MWKIHHDVPASTCVPCADYANTRLGPEDPGTAMLYLQCRASEVTIV
jgi:hypothetical protein